RTFPPAKISWSWTVRPNLLRGTSAAVRTAATPTRARARLASRRLIFAWGAETAKELDVEHRRQHDIHCIVGASRHGIRAVQARIRFSDDLKASHDADCFFCGA